MQQRVGQSFSLEQYRRRAGVYDLELAAFEPIRRSAVARLQLTRAIGCWTWPAVLASALIYCKK